MIYLYLSNNKLYFHLSPLHLGILCLDPRPFHSLLQAPEASSLKLSSSFILRRRLYKRAGHVCIVGSEEIFNLSDNVILPLVGLEFVIDPSN